MIFVYILMSFFLPFFCTHSHEQQRTQIKIAKLFSLSNLQTLGNDNHFLTYLY